MARTYAGLPTEQPLPKSRALDLLTVKQVLQLMNREDAGIPRVVAKVIPKIEHAVQLIVPAMRAGGRLFFVGAGTSGRLGIIEAAECPPTFNTPPTMVQALMAGGSHSVFRSQEGSEDREDEPRREVTARIHAGDVVIGIAASGITPYVRAALRTSKEREAITILVTCHPQTPKESWLDVLIAAPVGPEVITGSTRLKAGTATKLILNMMTVGTMVQLGKVYGHWMVDVRPTSKKLQLRAIRIIETLTGLSTEKSAELLKETGGEVKTAIVMSLRRVDVMTARRLLTQHDGHLRPILSPEERYFHSPPP